MLLHHKTYALGKLKPFFRFFIPYFSVDGKGDL